MKTSKAFSKGEFVLEYRGELLTAEEGMNRLESYDSSVGSFLYFFDDLDSEKW